ncbi:MAG: carboxynorspermidine decarboxylase [Cytophagales bacterium]|nr:carboxynorspermidine decarboxylase [Cytophagales bacterium]
MMNDKFDFDASIIPSPCFILDERLLIKNLELLRKIRDDAQIKILCALKGYAMWSTFPLLKKFLSGAAASSLNEARLSHETFLKDTHLCAPVYIEDEIEEITDLASHITFNSLQQYNKFGEIATKKGLKAALRINPEYSEITTDLYNPCVPGSRLGITRDLMPMELPKAITGFHFHTLCEQNADTFQRTLRVIDEKFGRYLKKVTWLNIGGGHHFTREDYDVELFVNTIKSFRKEYDLEIIAEPGEAIGWKTGYLLSTVQDVVEANGLKTAMLDVSFTAHMPDCLEMPYRPNVVGTVDNTGAFNYRLGGNTCLAGDFIDGYRFGTALEAGDKVIFDDMIHYTMVKTNTFNGVQLPSIGMITCDGSFKLIKSFDYKDFKNRLS